jgi:hypothetical protein
MIHAVAYYGKLAIHPVPLTSLVDIWERAAIGPLPGGFVVAAGVLFHAKLAHVRACDPSHRSCFATRAAQLDRYGIASRVDTYLDAARAAKARPRARTGALPRQRVADRDLAPCRWPSAIGRFSRPRADEIGAPMATVSRSNQRLPATISKNRSRLPSPSLPRPRTEMIAGVEGRDERRQIAHAAAPMHQSR